MFELLYAENDKVDLDKFTDEEKAYLHGVYDVVMYLKDVKPEAVENAAEIFVAAFEEMSAGHDKNFYKHFVNIPEYDPKTKACYK